MEKVKILTKKLDKLPPQAIVTVEEFVDFLISKGNSEKPKGKFLNLSWSGGLKNVKSKFNSIELSKKAMEWRKV